MLCENGNSLVQNSINSDNSCSKLGCTCQKLIKKTFVNTTAKRSGKHQFPIISHLKNSSKNKCMQLTSGGQVLGEGCSRKGRGPPCSPPYEYGILSAPIYSIECTGGGRWSPVSKWPIGTSGLKECIGYGGIPPLGCRCGGGGSCLDWWTGMFPTGGYGGMPPLGCGLGRMTSLILPVIWSNASWMDWKLPVTWERGTPEVNNMFPF